MCKLRKEFNDRFVNKFEQTIDSKETLPEKNKILALALLSLVEIAFYNKKNKKFEKFCVLFHQC